MKPDETTANVDVGLFVTKSWPTFLNLLYERALLCLNRSPRGRRPSSRWTTQSSKPSQAVSEPSADRASFFPIRLQSFRCRTCESACPTCVPATVGQAKSVNRYSEWHRSSVPRVFFCSQTQVQHSTSSRRLVMSNNTSRPDTVRLQKSARRSGNLPH